MAGTINKPSSKYYKSKSYTISPNPYSAFLPTYLWPFRMAEPKSKRVSTRLRKNIQKASASKQKKMRKKAKQNPEWRSKLKKDPGIPNLFPYKERILEEIEERRTRKAEEVQRRKEMAKAARTGVAEKDDAETLVDGVVRAEDTEDEFEDTMEIDGEDDDGDDSNPMAALLASARAAAQNYERQLQDTSDMEDRDSSGDEFGGDEVEVSRDSSRKTFDKVYKQVIQQADVSLYVLDARDPEGTRSREIERDIMAASAAGKRLIFILNKIDLVPPQVLKGWLAHLRRSFPTLPLRASNPAPNAHTFNHKDLTVQNTSGTLFRALKAFAASRNLKRAVNVGVIGYPNVGKSSVINALLSRLGGKAGAASKACPAGAEAGVTTTIRAVKIDNKLTLLDSPGIVFPSQPPTSGGPVAPKSAQEKHANLILLNVVPPKQIDDAVPAVTLLLKRMSATPDLLQRLLDVYDVPPLIPHATGDTTLPFLVEVARRRGRLGKGGVPNINAAAMTVVTDWRDGRIQGWTEAPILPVVARNGGAGKNVIVSNGIDADGESLPDEKILLSEWAEEFKLEALWGNDDDVNAAEADAMQA